MYAILSTPTFHDKAAQLALSLQIPLHTEKKTEIDFYLHYEHDGLHLSATHLKLGSLHLDFNTGQLLQRFQQASIRKEPLARAVGLHKKNDVHICDATAGVGREGCLLASLGAKVTLVERSPIVSALLQDALDRCQADWKTHVHLICTDSCDFLRTTTQHFDVIYLDPMFEEKSFKARVKKEMQYLQALMGPQQDADALLTAALDFKPERVVVKRPIKAHALLNKKPDFTLSFKTHRFDIYL